DTGRSRGFAFVEMDDEAADEAMKKLDGMDFEGRNLKINEARPRT
ncbi:MAG: RNA recognition motif domain-containing protein, partial [Desulfovermiculus sp.]